MIGITLIAILMGWKTPQIKAETINYTYKQYRVQFVSLSQGTEAWANWETFQTSTVLSNGYGVNTIAIRLGYNTFKAGQTYRVTIDTGMSPVEEKNLTQYNGFECYGSTSTSNWNNNAGNVQCQFITSINTTNTVHKKYIFDITPTVNIQGIQINISIRGTAEISSVNVYNNTTITTGPDITNAIDEQTTILENVITQTNEELINVITEQNTTCKIIDKEYIELNNKRLWGEGTISNDSNFGITGYINVDNSKVYLLEKRLNNYTASICYYRENKELINCAETRDMTIGEITLPTNTKYVRFTIEKAANRPQIKICTTNTQAIINEDHNYTGQEEMKDTEDILNENDEISGEIKEKIEGYNTSLFPTDMTNWNNAFIYIWNKITRYYNLMTPYITTILGLGIIKLVLGR